MNTTEQGRLGEAAIVAELVKNGYEVFHPLFGNTSCDFIVLRQGISERVECKTSDLKRGPSFVVSLRSVRHNTNDVAYKKFDSSKSEILAVYLISVNQVHLLRSRDYHGKTSVSIRPY